MQQDRPGREQRAGGESAASADERLHQSQKANAGLLYEMHRGRDRERALRIDLAHKTRLSQERELLARDADHRVKNVLQLAVGMLHLKAKSGVDDAVKAELTSMVSHLQNLAVVHTAFYELGAADCVPIDLWLRDVGDAMLFDRAVQIDTDLPPIEWPGWAATPLGLFVTEAISNALKHAFRASQGGRILVALRAEPSDLWRISVSDDGEGRPDWLAPGFGMKLLELFTLQLRGRLEVSQGLDGRGVTVSAIFSSPHRTVVATI